MTTKATNVSELRDHIAEQITHVEQRIKDGAEMGAAIWRIALEDVARENRAMLATLSPPLPSPEVERLRSALDKLLASCGARERYHALEYAKAVEEAEAALSALPLLEDRHEEAGG